MTQQQSLLIGSLNLGKIKEFQKLLAPYGVTVHSAEPLGVEDPEETGATFADNALLKADYYRSHCAMPVLSDDSGLMIPALDGAPGVLSARWAQREENGPRDFVYAMDKIQQLLPPSTTPYLATMICVLCYMRPDGSYEMVEGRIDGHLIVPGRTRDPQKAFGYDPFFQPVGYDRTFSEMLPEEKAAISHRTLAFKQLIDRVFR